MTKKRGTKYYRVTIHTDDDFTVDSEYFVEPLWGNTTFLIKGSDKLSKFIRSLKVLSYKRKEHFAKLFKSHALNEAILNHDCEYFYAEPFNYKLCWEPIIPLKIE